MQITVLGCRAGMPADGQPSSGYLLETGLTRILLDCGPGVATALSAMIDPETLDAVVVSHLHLDHLHDLLPLGKSLINRVLRAPAGDTDLIAQWASGALLIDPEFRPVRLLVPRGARSVLDRWAALFPVSTLPLLDRAFEVAFDVQEYDPGDRVRIGECTLDLHGLRHASPNCGTRISTDAGTVAYTGDTGMTDALIALADHADLLIAESTLTATDTSDHGHLSAADAGRVAASAQVGALLLTHFSTADPSRLATYRLHAEAAYRGPIHLASPGARIPVAQVAPAPLSA